MFAEAVDEETRNPEEGQVLKEIFGDKFTEKFAANVEDGSFCKGCLRVPSK